GDADVEAELVDDTEVILRRTLVVGGFERAGDLLRGADDKARASFDEAIEHAEFHARLSERGGCREGQKRGGGENLFLHGNSSSGGLRVNLWSSYIVPSAACGAAMSGTLEVQDSGFQAMRLWLVSGA